MFRITFPKNDLAPYEFSTMELLNAWLKQNKLANSFGRNERWKKEKDFDDDETIDTAIETRLVDGFYGPVAEYKFKADYTYSIEDITKIHKSAERRKRRMGRGKIVDAKCSNIRSYILGLDARLDEGELDFIMSHLSKGRLHAAISKIKISTTFTQEQKDDILEL